VISKGGANVNSPLEGSSKTVQKGTRTICSSRRGKVKGLVHPKMKILSVFTHPHVVPTP